MNEEKNYEIKYADANGKPKKRTFPILEDALQFVDYCFSRFLCVKSITRNGTVIVTYLDNKEKRDFFLTLLRNREIQLHEKTYRLHENTLEVEYPKDRIIRFNSIHDFFAFKSSTLFRSTTYFYNRTVSEELKEDIYIDRDGNVAHHEVELKRIVKEISFKKNPNSGLNTIAKEKD